MARGGAGGRIRFRAAKGGFASDPHDDLARKRNTSRFNVVNGGCFYRSRSRLCPNRLSDFYCVMWTEAGDEEQPAAAAPAGHNATLATSGKSASEVDSRDQQPLCSGDFTSEGLLLTSCVLAPLLLLVGSCLNCIGARLIKAAIQVSLALDTVRLIRQPISRLEHYTAEWVKNSTILAFVLVLLLNGHHLWTLAVVKVSGGSGDTEGAFYCGWTLRWPITEQFAVWIWPISDMLVGDLLPVAVVTACCIWGVSGGGLRRRRAGLAYYVIDVELHCTLRRGLLACCAGFVALSFPALCRSVAMRAAFFAHRLREPPHSVSRGRESSGWAPFWSEEDETGLYILRMCSGLRLFINPLLLLASVPRFRCDFRAAIAAAAEAVIGCCGAWRGNLRRSGRDACRACS